MSDIELKHLNVNYGNFEAVKDVSFSVRNGKCLAIIGESGCGKTTLLRSIAGLITPKSGVIEINHINVTDTKPSQRHMAMIFQNAALFPNITVRKNILYGTHILGITKENENKKIHEISERLGILSYLDRYPESLSAGQKQRVGIARALIRDPNILLLDEPFSNLDQLLKDSLHQELIRIKNELGVTMIFVTHDQQEAINVGDEIAVMHEGKIEEINMYENLLNHPTSLYTASFFGNHPMNIIHKSHLTDNISMNENCEVVGIRSNWIYSGNKQTGIVKEVHRYEDWFRYLIQWDETEIIMDSKNKYDLEDEISFDFDENKMIFYDKRGHIIDSV